MYKLFVYGTLRKGEGNHELLRDAEFLGEHTTEPKFTMVDMGAFPGVILDGKNSISGEVYEVNPHTYRRVEMLEGYHPDPKSTFYSKHIVDTEFGEAEMYVLDPSYLGYPVIESGKWR